MQYPSPSRWVPTAQLLSCCSLSESLAGTCTKLLTFIARRMCVHHPQRMVEPSKFLCFCGCFNGNQQLDDPGDDVFVATAQSSSRPSLLDVQVRFALFLSLNVHWSLTYHPYRRRKTVCTLSALDSPLRCN